MGLFPAVLLHGGVRLRLRRWCCQVVECHGTQPIILASGAGIRGFVGLDDIADRSLSYSPVGGKDVCS